ncbi:hypothetical protein J31TS4_18600 [Paenibacillus sp. J31TS4]|uniref:hypothetical protein n=1 Tax=Paenibacillus sp. J31TS4 TaxID=2807195 RepID=UPI001B118B0B|nr:hypothetical protein [Paenibacillus sp. J31TS4]GIP38580.1 hypothetical protein J31TS4_18600 [Paenibacillus sp. J31TS4]
MKPTRSEFEKRAAEWREVRLPRIDVSRAVLEAIREPGESRPGSAAERRQTRRFSRSRRIGVMTAALFFLVALTVGASVLPIHWEGGVFTIENDGGRNARIDAWKEKLFGPEPSYRDQIEDVLRTGRNMEKAVTLEEAERTYPFPLLRPSAAENRYQPVRTAGAWMNVVQQEKGQPDRVVGHNPVLHDFYELADGRWAVVTQSVDEAATRHAAEGGSRSGTFVGSWEQVDWSGRALAMYIQDAKQNRLVLEYKTASGQMLDVRLIGTASREELIALAEAYIGKRN